MNFYRKSLLRSFNLTNFLSLLWAAERFWDDLFKEKTLLWSISDSEAEESIFFSIINLSFKNNNNSLIFTLLSEILRDNLTFHLYIRNDSQHNIWYLLIYFFHLNFSNQLICYQNIHSEDINIYQILLKLIKVKIRALHQFFFEFYKVKIINSDFIKLILWKTHELKYWINIFITSLFCSSLYIYSHTSQWLLHVDHLKQRIKKESILSVLKLIILFFLILIIFLSNCCQAVLLSRQRKKCKYCKILQLYS